MATAGGIDAQLAEIAARHRKAVAEGEPMQAQLLILDADALLDQRPDGPRGPADTRPPTRAATHG
jgi:hypothetical protein